MQEFLYGYIEFGKQLSILEIVLLSFIGFIFLVRFLYDFFIYGRLMFSGKPEKYSSTPPFSLIMAVRNEEENMRENLPKILASEYPDFEVVVIDDFSQDQTYTLLGLSRKDNAKLRISSLNQETRHSSKQALNIGLKAAQNDWVLILKPSMAEFQPGWLSSFAEKAGEGKNLVIGYSNIETQEGFYNWAFRVESFMQQIQSYAYIKAGRGFIFNEDNICFLKHSYFDLRGFAGAMKEEYADLELLVNKFIKKRHTVLNFSSDGFVKEKRFITAKKYKELTVKANRIFRKLGLWNRFLLFADNITSLLILPLSVVLGLVFPEIIIASGLLVLLKLILHSIIIYKAAKRVNEQKIFVSSLLYELIMPYYKVFSRWNYFSSLRKH